MQPAKKLRFISGILICGSALNFFLIFFSFFQALDLGNCLIFFWRMYDDFKGAWWIDHSTTWFIRVRTVIATRVRRPGRRARAIETNDNATWHFISRRMRLKKQQVKHSISFSTSSIKFYDNYKIFYIADKFLIQQQQSH